MIRGVINTGTYVARSSEEGSNPGLEGRGSEIGFYGKNEQVHKYMNSKNSQGKKLKLNLGRRMVKSTKNI